MRRGYFFAFLFLLAVDGVFLAPALFTSAVRAPADVTPHWPPFRADAPNPPPPRNELLNDWLLQFHPWQHLVREAYAEGRVPLWNDTSGCGEPLLANIQCEAVSPYLPILLFCGDQYVDWRQLAQLVIAQTFCVLLAAHLGMSAGASVIVALAYGFSSFMQIWAVHPHSASASFAPGILWAMLRLAAVPSAGRLLVAALCVAFSVLAGHIETAAKAGLVAALLAFLHGMLRRPAAGRFRFTLLIAAAGICGVLLAACVLVPFFDYLSQSDVRARRKLSVDQVLPVAQLVTLLDKDALGSALSPPTYHGVGNYPDSVLHVGVVNVVLAALGVFFGVFRRPALVLSALLVGAMGVVIACGIVPVAGFWSSVPGLGDIWPFRFLYCAILPLALLAGVGFDAVGRLTVRLSQRVRRFAALSVVVAAAATSTLPWRDFLPAAQVTSLHPRSRALETLGARRASGRSIELGRVCHPGFGALYGFRQIARYDAIGLRRFSDLFPITQDNFPIFNYDRVTFAPPAHLDALSVRWVLSMYQAAEARYPAKPWLVVAGAPASFDRGAFSQLDRPPDLVVFRMGVPLRDGTIEVAFDQPDQEVVWSLRPEGWTASVGPPPGGEAPSPAVTEFIEGQLVAFNREIISIPTALWKSTARITFRVKDGGLPFRVTALVADGIGKDVIETENMGWLRISERRSAMPYAYLSPAIAGATDHDDAVKRVHALGFDPHVATVVELGISDDDIPGAPLSATGHASIKRFEPGRIEVEVHAATDRMLVVTDAFARGWTARVDGREVPIYAANLVGKSCWVPAGTHTIVMRYAPWSFTIGCAISAVTLFFLIGITVTRRRSRPKPTVRTTASGTSPTTPPA